MPKDDDPKKREPQPTVSWDPQELAKLHASDAAGGQPRREGEDPLVGQLLRDRWRVLSRLGSGSFGTVYKVRDEKGGWVEALKILAVDRSTGAEAQAARERFLREAQIMKRLGTESQHIVALSTYEEDLGSGLVYFLMELVEGRSLADLVQEEGPLAPERVLHLARQVCSALVVAHEGPDTVVHRDLKLDNIMVTRDRAGEESVKILDFGIAMVAERETVGDSGTMGTLGTPGYAAPEQLRSEGVDGRTDLFAFGVILYALLTGRDPWMGNPAGVETTRIQQVMVASERAQVLPMSDAGVEVPAALGNVVLRLLRRDPADRFPSARALADALDRIAAGGLSVDVASLRVGTGTSGVEVEIRAGRRLVAEGRTPLLANGLEPGAYRVALRDPRFERVETTVTLPAGGLEDLTLVAAPRRKGLVARVRRRPLLALAALVVVAAGTGAAWLRPWGRTLDLPTLQAAVADGRVRQAWLTADGVAGTLVRLGLPVSFRTPVAEGDMTAAVDALKTAGLVVDPSWEVDHLLQEAVRAQAAGRYFGREGEDVRSYAQRILALEPHSPEARSLLLKVAEHMAWDADAAREEGAPERARALVDACLALVPAHPACRAAEVEP